MVQLQATSTSIASASRERTLIAGPSLGTTTALWSRATQLLEPQLSVVAWDLPGHGGSPRASGPLSIRSLADDVVALADRHDIDTFHYAGVSIGGAVGIELAAAYPDRLLSSTIVCSAAKIGESQAWRERAARARQDGLGFLRDATTSRWFSPAFVEEHPELVREMLDTLVATSAADYALLCEALAEFDAREYLASIHVPMLVLSGELDPVTPPELGSALADGVVNGRHLTVRGASHQAVIESPRIVGEAILEFCTEIEGRTA